MRKKRIRLVSILVGASAMLSIVSASGDGNTGDITGRVYDRRTGLPIPSATVLIRHAIVSTVTDSYGNYSISGLDPGTYEVRTYIVDYNLVLFLGVAVSAGQATTLDVPLNRTTRLDREFIRAKPWRSSTVVVSHETKNGTKQRLAIQTILDPDELGRECIPGFPLIMGHCRTMSGKPCPPPLFICAGIWIRDPVIRYESTIQSARRLTLPNPFMLKGDVNDDQSVNAVDLLYLAYFVFKGGPDLQPDRFVGDINCDGGISGVDIVLLVDYMFLAGPEPEVCFSKRL